MATEDEVQTRLRCADEPAAPATVEPSGCQPAGRDNPALEEERPRRHRRKREKRRPKKKSPFLGAEPDKKPGEGSKGTKGTNAVIRRKLRSRGLGQELSPKCLYSRPPEDNETGTGNQDGGRGECDGTSNNGSR